jgi:hypothetical protein
MNEPRCKQYNSFWTGKKVAVVPVGMNNSVDYDNHALLWNQLCDAANRNDATAVSSILHCRKLQSPSIDDPLLCSSVFVDRLLQDIQQQFVIVTASDKDDGMSVKDDAIDHSKLELRDLEAICSIHISSAFKALLISPSIYETPWKLCCAFVEFMHQSSIIQGSMIIRTRLSKNEITLSSLYRSCITDIQCFLQQVVTSWWDEDKKQSAADIMTSPTSSSLSLSAGTGGSYRRRSVRAMHDEVLSERNPRHWMLQLVQLVVDPLLVTSDVVDTEGVGVLQTSPEAWTMSLELISTVVSLSNDIEKSLLHAILDLLFGHESKKIRWDSILRWINVASELRLFLRDDDWKSIYTAIQNALLIQPCPIPTHHWSSLVGHLFSAGVMEKKLTTSVKHTAFVLCWHELILQFLLLGTISGQGDVPAPYIQMEVTLRSCLASLPSHALHHWALKIFNIGSNVSLVGSTAGTSRLMFIEANVTLLVWCASQQSGSLLVSRLVAIAFDGYKSSNTKSLSASVPLSDLNTECWNRLMQLVVPMSLMKNHPISRFRGYAKYSNDADVRQRCTVKALRELFEGVMYNGKGTFKRHVSDDVDYSTTVLTGISSFVLQSIYFDASQSLTSGGKGGCQETERSQMWLRCVNGTLQSRVTEGFLDFVVAIVVFVTIYFETPNIRPFIARILLQTLSTKSDTNNNFACVVYTIVITVVLTPSLQDNLPVHDTLSDLDAISGLLVQPLPFALFCDIAQALSPLQSARNIMMANIRKQIDGVTLTTQTSNKVPIHYKIQRNHESYMCSLFSLILLLQKSAWGNFEVTAWLILSDIIVDNKAHLPFLTRTWIFQELRESITKGKFQMRALSHLLRACLVRLTDFVGPVLLDDQEPSPLDQRFAGSRMVQTTQTEDIVGLFNLVFTILHYECKEGNDAESVALYNALNRCRYILSDLIGIECHQTTQNAMEDVRTSDNAPSTVTEVSVESNFPCIVAFYCLALAFRPGGGEKILFDGIALLPHDEIRRSLVRRELEELQISRESITSSGWLVSRHHSTSISNLDEEHGFKKQPTTIILALCDVVVSLFMGPKRWIDSNFNGSFTDQWYKSPRLCTQVTALFSLKRRLNEALDEEYGSQVNVAQYQEAEALERSFSCFCEVIVPFLKENLVSQSNFMHTDEMLSVTLDLCDMLSIRSATDFGAPSSQRLEYFFSLYYAVAEENAAIRCIGYLESRSKDGSVTIRNFSLKVPDDIDCFVRRLRTSFFRCLTHGFVDYIKFTENESSGNVLKIWEHEGSAFALPLESIVRYLESVANDIAIGLAEGASGGLTHDLYVSMIDSIDQCANFLLKCLKSTSKIELEFLVPVSSVCVTISNRLEGILCNFALQQATALKKTLSLCAGTLPSVVRWCRRHPAFASDSNQVISMSNASGLFEQLIGVLKRKAELDCSFRLSWEHVAGKDHLGGMKYLSDSDDEVSELSDGFADLVKSHRELPRNIDQSCGIKSTLLLRTERSWTWSLCCVLEAFEYDWAESFSLIHNVPETSQFENKLSRDIEIRQNELTLSINCICQLFHCTRSQSTVAESTIATVYAVHMPTNAKVKLCSTVDRIVATLQKSMKQLLSQAQAQLNPGYAGICCLSFSEALSCLNAWLSMQSCHTELCTGVQQWYLSEKLLSAGVSRDAKGMLAEDVSMLRRLPKLFFRCEELQTSLLKLSQNMHRHASSLKRGDSTLLLEMIDSIISKARPGSLSFQELLLTKLAFLKQEQHHINDVFGLSSSDDTSSGKKRKRAIDVANRIQKERRQRVVRSRNSVVDMWLQADRETGEEETLNDDAYADLEDFLVDG